MLNAAEEQTCRRHKAVARVPRRRIGRRVRVRGVAVPRAGGFRCRGCFEGWGWLERGYKSKTYVGRDGARKGVLLREHNIALSIDPNIVRNLQLAHATHAVR